MLRAPLRGQSWRAFGRPEVALAIIILLISAVFAAGEVGEEARFLISLLPMLAAAGGVVVCRILLSTAMEGLEGTLKVLRSIPPRPRQIPTEFTYPSEGVAEFKAEIVAI
ncbi:MAG: hypothetical protein IPP17_28300 [Bacteroidetes bacterium]|nr:hypothetical protein [Bacteroidota bacterium]